jgi:hypothetical protein
MSTESDLRFWHTAHDTLKTGRISSDDLERVLRLCSVVIPKTLLERAGNTYSMEEALVLYRMCQESEPRNGHAELVKCLSLVNDRKSDAGRLISISDFQSLNKIINKREIAYNEVLKIFDGRPVIEIDALARNLLT